MKRLSSNLLVIDLCLGTDGYVADYEIVAHLDCCLKTARRIIHSIEYESDFMDRIKVDVKIERDGETVKNKIHKIRVTA